MAARTRNRLRWDATSADRAFFTLPGHVQWRGLQPANRIAWRMSLVPADPSERRRIRLDRPEQRFGTALMGLGGPCPRLEARVVLDLRCKAALQRWNGFTDRRDRSTPARTYEREDVNRVRYICYHALPC